MRILILNWRDIKNPKSGGAEILTHEIAKRLVGWGYEVTQFSSVFPNAKKEEVIDGVKIIRRGSSDIRYFFNSVHFMAFWYYKKHFKGKFDIVIDEIHGIPFFTPFYIKERKIALICEVAGDIWDVIFKFPLNRIGRFVEDSYFNFYKNIPFLTISPSTEKALIKKGIKKDQITVLPMGITTLKELNKFSKEKNPTLIFVGRLIKTKGIEDAVLVCKKLKKTIPNIKLWVIGKGERGYKSYIEELIMKAGVKNNVNFFDFVSEEKKFELMQKAHILLMPSMKEGFGLTVPEAGFVGTPTVAYNVEGLRDIINDGTNGFLVNSNVEAMEEKVKELLLRKEIYKKTQEEAMRYARSLNWDNTAKKAFEFLK